MFEDQTRSMVRSIIVALMGRGLFASKQEAVQKLADRDWLAENGYGHVGQILGSDLALSECVKIYEEIDARSMAKLKRGIHEFRSKAFLSQKELFEHLGKTQNPDILFITCSDSRVVPNLITQTEPGELFIIRNAGNIVPPADVASGEAATVEFAVNKLQIRDIIVCGHSDCGAMKALISPDQVGDMPMMTSWLQHAQRTRTLLVEAYSTEAQASLIDIAIQENVLVQMENLRSHPTVKAALDDGRLNLHGWVYQIHTGDVFAYYPELGQFLPIGEHTELSAVAKMPGRQSI